MLNFYKSVPVKKQTLLYIGWPEGEYVFSKSFFVNCSFENKIIYGGHKAVHVADSFKH